jgi:hypothetical protein
MLSLALDSFSDKILYKVLYTGRIYIINMKKGSIILNTRLKLSLLYAGVLLGIVLKAMVAFALFKTFLRTALANQFWR